MVFLPVLPATAAGVRAATAGRRGETATRPRALSPAPVAAPPVAPSLSVTKVDSFPDPDGDGKAEPGQTITYTVTVTNNGTDATNVQLSDTIDPGTTLVPGSVATQPIASDDTYSVLGNVRIQPGAAAGLLANDCDPDNGGTCSSTGLTASGPATSAQGGNVTVNANGSFSYNPPAGYEGPDSFTYTVTDPTGKTDTATASLTVSDVVWFIDNNAPGGGDGRLTSPYNSLASVSGGSDLDEPSDVIFVHEGAGAYAGGIVLEDNQKLVGQGMSLDAALATFGITVPAHSDARPAATSAPTLSNGAGDAITLANNNAVYSVNAAASASGTSAVAGNAVGGASLVNVGASAGGSANGVSLVNLSGGFTMTGGSVNGNSTGTAVSVNGGASPASFNGVAVSQNGGRVVDVQNRTGGAVSFDAATSVAGMNGTTDAVSLLSNTGGLVTFAGPVTINTSARGLVADSATVNLTNGGNAVSSTGAAAVDLENLTVNISFATTFSTNSAGRGLRVDNVAGSASFGNTSVSGSGNTGVLLTDNSASVSFSDLDIAPAPNTRALHATDNTGAITSTSGTVVTTGAVAVEIDGPASRTPLNVQLTSVSADGGGTGILVRDTSDGGNGFRVTGTGTTDGSGGTLSNVTDRGASFINADDISLSNMTFTNVGTANGADPTNALSACGDIGPGGGGNAGCNAGVHLDTVTGASLTNVDMSGGNQVGINGNAVTNFSLSNSNVLNFGDQVREDGLKFRNLLGTSSISGTTISGNEAVQVEVQNDSGTLAVLDVTGSSIGNGVAPNGSHGILFNMRGTAAGKLQVHGGTSFSNLFSNCVETLKDGTSGTMEVIVTGSTFSGCGASGVNVVQNGAAPSAVSFNIHDNGTAASPTFLGGNASHAINVNQASAGTGTMEGAITGNYIGDNSSPTSSTVGGNGINIVNVSTSVATVLVQDNVVRGVGSNGINAQMGNTAVAAATTHRLNLTLLNNQAFVTSPAGFDGIRIQSGTAGTHRGTLCAEIKGNTGASAAANDFAVRQRGLTTFQLRGYTGANNNNGAVQAHLDVTEANDPAGAGLDWFINNTVSTGGGGFVNTPGGAQCPQPALPVEVSFAPSAEAGARELLAAQPAAPAGASSGAATGGLPGKLRRGYANAERAQALTFGSATGSARPEPLKAAAAAAAAFAGETVNLSIGTLKAGDSVTITFQVTVADPWTGAQPQVSNQATVTADGGVSVLSDDPSEPGAADPTVTPLLLPPTINVNDATVAEPASGSTNALFTVTLSHPFTQTVTVNYSTANGGANPADATDYTTTGGTVTFNAGQTVQTVSVPVLADGTAAEGNETFLVNLSGATNGTVGDGQATGTITDESVASPVIISELRTNGPNGSADEFVELLNTTDNDITVASTDGSAGWALLKRGATCSDTPVVVGVVPNGTVIPARGNYLFTGSGYGLAAYAAGNGTTATGDAVLTADIENDGNVGLFTVANLANVSSVNRLDAVGFGTNTTDNCDLLREGNTLTPNVGFSVDYSFVRKVEKGQTVDTTDNAADFIVVDTNGTLIGGQQRLGAPGPENLSSPRGPVPCAAPTGSAKFARELIDPTVGVGVAPNVVRDLTSDPANNSTFGTLDFRRTFTNNTGGAVTRLRFRITNLSTFPAAGGTADLRARTSGSVVVTTAAGNKTVLGTTLEQPPSQPNGGGVNASLSAGTITLATPLASGASVNLHFLFGVQQTGDYDIGVVLESAPNASGKDFWRVTGHTENGGHTDGGCNKPPVADAGDDQNAECVNGQASVTLDGSGSTDPDGDTPLAYEWKEGATVLGTSQMINVTLVSGPHTITLKVTDPSGDSSTDTVVVNVVDTEDPVVTPPANVTVYTGPGASSCGAVVSDATLGTATAADGCEGSLAVNRTGVPAGNFFPVGTTQVTYKATDAAGNEGTAVQNVTVIDNTVPTVTPPANVVVNADPGSCSAMVDPGTATGSDNCAVQSVNGVRSDNQTLNAPYPVGTTTITWTVTDASGNTASANQTVTVVDNQPPTVTSSVAVTTMGPPHNHALINVGLSATASDNCSNLGPLQIKVYSDEDDGAAPHSPDAVDIGLGTLKLRRERDGGANGRVYLIVVKATDGAGNTSVSVNTVTVPLGNSAAYQASVNAQAAAAASYASANGGAPPAGFFEVGP